MKKPKVGETVYLVWFGNKTRIIGNREVVKVGKKYFEVSGTTIKFYIDTWTSKDSCSDQMCRVFESEQAYEEYRELVRLNHEIKEYFTRHREPKITLNQARRIMSILNENE